MSAMKMKIIYISLYCHIRTKCIPKKNEETIWGLFFRYTQTQATTILFTCQSIRPRLLPAGEKEDSGKDEDGDLADVRVPASPAPTFSLSSSLSIEGGSGGGRPARQ